MVNRQFVLNGRPVGMPKESDLRMVETPVPALRDGEMLAAGAVGSVVGQIAKIKGCRAVGIVGGPEKARYVIDECGFDAALDYKATADYQAAIKELCPGGVDVYSDNVGGPIADAVLANLNMRARIGIYGQISHAHDTRPSTGPRMWRHILVARARVQGFLVFDYAARYGSALEQLAQWVGSMGTGKASCVALPKNSAAFEATCGMLYYAGKPKWKSRLESLRQFSTGATDRRDCVQGSAA